jgi:thienamycin biosynthesis protein ThnN
MSTLKDFVQERVAMHFDPKWGAPYWLDSEAELPFNPRMEIQTVEDLLRFPPFPLNVLATRPIEDFIPKSYHDNLAPFTTAETGGATGAPKRTAYHPDDFAAAFVTPFVGAAELMNFPQKLNWLFIGPSGPHIIGKAARECARALGSMDPFSVDFDPRWVRKLPEGSMGRTRYLEHVLEQAIRVLDTQHIGVLFSTPPVLEELGERLTAAQREGIGGIHLGGMAALPAFWKRLTDEFFPNAVVLSGYGNSLAGVCPQVSASSDSVPVYVPHGERIAFSISADKETRRGAVRFHRLDKACFLPHVVEGDEAEPVSTASNDAVAAGFHMTGICDPRPAAQQMESRQGGLY